MRPSPTRSRLTDCPTLLLFPFLNFPGSIAGKGKTFLARRCGKYILDSEDRSGSESGKEKFPSEINERDRINRRDYFMDAARPCVLLNSAMSVLLHARGVRGEIMAGKKGNNWADICRFGCRSIENRI